LSSIELGLTVKMCEASAALICLGDQPQIEERSVRSVCDAFLKTRSNLVVPSYQMQRGHPWLAARGIWDEILLMREPDTMRNFLKKHNKEIQYVECDTPTILQDLDTPDDYLKYKPSL
jgi:molybdenum cofactor cytidylyltransferase